MTTAAHTTSRLDMAQVHRWTSLTKLARAVKVSPASMKRAARGHWPAIGEKAMRERINAAVIQLGAQPADLDALYQAPKKVGPDVQQHAEAVPAPVGISVEPETTLEKEKDMLLQFVALTPQAREHFGLPRNPFVDDVQTTDDVFQTASIRYVRRSLYDCALHQGFIGIYGESGAGKSTLAEDLEERIRQEGKDVSIIRPYVLAMEESDAKGKTLKSSQIAEAVLRTLDPGASIKSSPEARFDQVSRVLKSSAASGRKHLLLIEEAHCMPEVTMSHLKRWLEIKDGMRRLIGVALVGQTELRTRLERAGPRLREVAQRIELIELGPLDADVEGYLQHKFARFELPYAKVFAGDAADAIRARLIHTPRGGKQADTKSMCYPLVVNNLVSRAMNAAAAAGYPVVDGQVITHC